MWRVPDEDDIAATLSLEEADAYSQSSGFSADVVRRLVERTCDYVRDALRSNGKVRRSPVPFEIPSGTVSKAMDYLVVDLLKRFVTKVNGQDFAVFREEKAAFIDITVAHQSLIAITSSLGIGKITVS